MASDKDTQAGKKSEQTADLPLGAEQAESVVGGAEKVIKLAVDKKPVPPATPRLA